MTKRRGQSSSKSTSGKSKSAGRKWATPTKYPRTARVNEAIREVIAGVLEREIDEDGRLELVTITGIDTDPDLKKAIVYFSALDTDASLEDVTAALDAKRVVLQAAVAKNVRLKSTPHLKFLPDPGIVEGQRVEDLLRTLPPIVDQPDLDLDDDTDD